MSAPKQKGKPLGPIQCAECGECLAVFDSHSEAFDPTPGQLLERGAVPVPNFGWFCSQACATRYEARSTVRFARDLNGKVRYYP